jgi:AcrR family transcriptional regulator
MPRRQAAVATARRARTEAPLNRDRILDAAVDLADRDGIDSLSMRKLAQQLGVDPMSLYNHVRDKDDLLDGIVDVVVGEIQPVVSGPDWRSSLRATILAARQTLLRHPWTARVIESRPDPSPSTLRHMEHVMEILRSAGFSLEMAHHALHVLGSRVLGFSQDLFDDSDDARPDPEAAAMLARQLAVSHPRLGELAAAVTHEGGLGGCDDDVEFEFGLDLILDGLDRLR